MNGFFIFVFIVFFVVPLLKNIFGGGDKKGKKPNNYGKTHNQVQNGQIRDKTNNHGHSTAKKRTHNQLHSRDNSSVFPKEHQEHVRARDIRDTQKFKVMEKTIHSRKNRGVIQASNKSSSDWGSRGDKEILSLTNIVKLVIVAAIAYAVVQRFFPEIL